MKTTFDLPDDLVRQLKLRAVHDRRKLKDITAEFLRHGLAAPSHRNATAQPKIIKDKKTGLPVIQCRRAPARNQQLSPDAVAQILLEQDTRWATEGGA